MTAETLDDRAEGFGDDLNVLRDGPVATVVMNRPDKLNAMRRNFWPDLRAVFDALESDPAIRVVIITGAGERAFSAGGDIAAFRDLTTLTAKRNFQLDAMKTFARVENSPLPVIAAVNGYALGGGCELTLACDIVIASDRARFGMPEAALGLVPGYGILRAPDVIGRQMTKLMIFAKAQLDAARALDVGLIQEVVPHDALMSRARALAAEIAQSSPIAMEVGKKVVNRGTGFAEFDYATEALTVLQATSDTDEGTRAFLEKRKPRFGARF